MPRRLDTDFEQLIFEHRAYLEPHLTVTEVARRLHSNKTYVDSGLKVVIKCRSCP